MDIFPESIACFMSTSPFFLLLAEEVLDKISVVTVT